MKRLVLLLSLVLLLALAACGGQPANQEVLPTGAVVTSEAIPLATTDLGAPAEATSAPSGEQMIPALAGTTWEWVETTTPTETITAVDPARYVIQFNADGTAFITADCNSVQGTYQADETGALTIVLGASTLVGCPEDTQDQVFLSALASATNYFTLAADGDLYIDQIADAGTMRLRATTIPDTGGFVEPAAGLTGVTWEWVSVIDPMGQTPSADPTRYTITFNEDGTANITADCNSVVASYETDGQSLTLVPGAGTLMACPPDSQDQLFLTSLTSAASYAVEDGELFVELQADAGTIMFRQAGSGAETTTPAEPAGAPTLTGTTWQWVETTTPTESVAAADPARYAVTFNADGTLTITADCNSATGNYTTGEGNSLAVTLGASTAMACPEDSQADRFLAALGAAAGYSFEGSDLLIDQTADAGTMRLRSGATAGGAAGEGTAEAGQPSLTGTTWQWQGTTTPVEPITAADPTRYTITFNEDGTASIKADCNQVTATYTVTDTALSIVPGASTLAMCPPDSQATEFVNGLSSAALFFFQDGELYIDQFASSGTMRFAAAGAAEQPGKGETTAPAGGLVGTKWQLTLISKPDGNITINDPSRFTVTFNADGSANVQADCNVVIATYTTGEGNALTITPGPSTMAFCGASSFDQIFLGGLTNAMSYRMESGNLVIDMLYESGSMAFAPAS